MMYEVEPGGVSDREIHSSAPSRVVVGNCMGPVDGWLLQTAGWSVE